MQNSPAVRRNRGQANARYRMPAEWEMHEACIMAWPARDESFAPYFERAKEEYAAVANAIAAFEPVAMVTNPGQAGEVRQRCSSAVEIFEVPIDDSWTRDSGPVMVVDENGRRAGVDFAFNSWGERFLPYDKDAAMSARVLELLGIERIPSAMVLEGGSITVDGEGTLITTEQCLLNPNRNPGWSRQQIEDRLRQALGVEVIIWLPYGLAENSVTDGHVDGVCAFVRPGAVLLQTVEDRSDPNWDRLEANRRVLQQSRDAAGRPIEVLEMPYLGHAEVGGRRVRVPSL